MNSSKIIDYYKPNQGFRRGLDVLGLVVFCITFGAVLANMQEKGKIMIQFFEALNEASIRISIIIITIIFFFALKSNIFSIKVRLVMWFSPFGISSLVCVAVLEMEDPENVFKSKARYLIPNNIRYFKIDDKKKGISFYMMTVLVGLAIQAFIVLPLVYFIITRKNVLIFAKNMVCHLKFV